MPATHTYSPIFHVPATARTQLAPTCRYAQYAETPTPLALVGGSAKRCAFRGMTVVARSEAKGEYGRREPRWGYVARCAPPIFHLLFRINGMPSVLLRPTANSSFAFSAKERDPETGLSYFGSRYYSSDLSVWLSVDPMSGFVQKKW